ncbi:MAG: DUF2945 domain-containing protein [Bdellovibrionaceae bacterium]|nr:DUF2945 domain-containing protein [Pseudobdellovibrionaceae bacterium]
MKFKKGSPIQWRWLGNTIEGVVLEVFTKPVVREIKGKKIKRNGSAENPAYLVKSSAGNEALKLGTELTAAAKDTRPKPKMFC